MEQKVLQILEFDKIIEKLVKHTVSSLGRELVKELEPSSDFFEVEKKLKETTHAVELVIKKGSPPLGGIHDIRVTVKRAQMGGILSPGELLKVADVLRGSRRIRNYLTADRLEVNKENTVRTLITTLFVNRGIEDKISHSIISAEEISDNASSTLSSIRRKIRILQDSIKDKLNNIIRSSRYQKLMQEAVVTMRGDRYVIPVKQEYRGEFPGLVHDMSSSGQTVFIEPMVVVEANNEIRQLHSKETIEIERILMELTEDVATITEELLLNCSILGRLDFVMAKAKLALDYNGVCPVLNQDRDIIIKKGRHPLLDKKTVVPIDIHLGKDFSSLVITGPNTGGKTVTLKTVGLFTLMTQAGLHIPVDEGSEMGIFKKVFADIGDEQSIEQSLSTFSSHMKNIVHILEEVDTESLVLFDELGAGTDPTEGAALATAILETLRKMDARTIATTHYSELKLYAMSQEGVENACCEFDVGSLKPTYRLLVGVPGKSNAFAISSRLGLGENIIEKAKAFLTQDNISFEDLLTDIEQNRSRSERERRQAEQYRSEVERYKTELEKERKKINSEKENILRQARQEARSIIKDARGEADELLNKLRELEKEHQALGIEQKAHEIKMQLKKKVDSLEESLTESLIPRVGYVEPPKNLKPGETVLVLTLDRKGTVLQPPDKDGQVQIQAGIMKVNVHVSNLKRVNEQKSEIERINSTRVSGVKSRPVKTEIDLRGFNIEEAIDKIDKYIDDATIAGLSEVTLVHGKGTGALRKGVHDFIKNHPHVDTYRLGKYGEGESGVTVVKLN